MANPTGRGGWQQGQSGNPRGRPPTGRALAEALRKEAQRVRDYQGERLNGKRLLARFVFDGIVTGKVTFADGSIMTVSEEGFRDLLKFAYKHLDGDVKQEIDVTSGGEAIRVILDV